MAINDSTVVKSCLSSAQAQSCNKAMYYAYWSDVHQRIDQARLSSWMIHVNAHWRHRGWQSCSPWHCVEDSDCLVPSPGTVSFPQQSSPPSEFWEHRIPWSFSLTFSHPCFICYKLQVRINRQFVIRSLLVAALGWSAVEKFQPRSNRFNRISIEPGNFWRLTASRYSFFHGMGKDYNEHKKKGLHWRLQARSASRNRKLRRQWNHSLHQLRKRRHIGPKGRLH